MKQELRFFFTALMFYTRIPCPKWVDYSEEFINRSIRYFPFIGLIVGAVVGLSLLAATYMVSVTTAVLFSLVAGVLTTGAFHEDGFADTCDGFGGGWTKEKILLIMKDSRLGTYGAVGLVLLFGLKISLILEVVAITALNPVILMLFFLSSHALSRATAASFMLTHAYVRDTGGSKAKPAASQSRVSDQLIGLCFGLLPLLGLVFYSGRPVLLLQLLPLYVAKIILGRYFMRWIGGYTGDCLGATQQVTEVVFYLFFILLWKFI